MKKFRLSKKGREEIEKGWKVVVEQNGGIYVGGVKIAHGEVLYFDGKTGTLYTEP